MSAFYWVLVEALVFLTLFSKETWFRLNLLKGGRRRKKCVPFIEYARYSLSFSVKGRCFS